jgi:hypothetical protein
MTVLLQFGFLFLVIIRRPVARWELLLKGPLRPNRLEGFLDWVFGKDRLQKNESLRELKDAERSVFRVFNFMAFVCLLCYITAIFWLLFARGIGTLAFVFLAFGILLGTGNLIGLLSRRTGTNLHFVLIALVFLIGLFVDPHRVRLAKAEPADTAQRLLDGLGAQPPYG